MSRQNGFYRVRHHGEEKIMKWTLTNDDNTETVAGYWNGDNSYTGNDHDLDFIDEKKLTDKQILKNLNK